MMYLAIAALVDAKAEPFFGVPIDKAEALGEALKTPTAPGWRASASPR
jgi:hypothetical protein